MIPLFANPAGLWLLLGLPAILAIHFLQQRTRVVRTSTWFLIEKLAPDSARGRTFDRLRSSRTLWLQLAAVCVATWVLAEPRWVRADSAQTIVLVLDASASMDAFRSPAVAAAEREMALADGLAARTTWVVMTTNPRQPALYRGLDRTAAIAALAAWQPDLGQHDFAASLRLARGLAGAAGRTLLITDRREKVPADQRAAGVGQPIDNVGFAGATVTVDETGAVWRALVKNHTASPQQRTWHFEAGGAQSAPRSLALAPGALVEISARLADGVAEGTVVLSADPFAADDRLPLVRPQPKPLRVNVDGEDDAAEFFRRLARDIPGVQVRSTPAGAMLRLARASQDEIARERRGGIFWAPADQRAQVPLVAEPVTPESDPLVAGLNWQGWIGGGPHGLTALAGDRPLLWQGKWPLVLLRPAASAPISLPPVGDAPARSEAAGGSVSENKLLLAFDWSTSNAPRLPAMVLLARRFLEAERDAQPAPYTANFDGGARVPLANPGAPRSGGGLSAVTLAFTPAGSTREDVRALTAAELAELRAPGRPGFFRVAQGNELLVRGAAQFGDARQGDFRAAGRFFLEQRRERQAAVERNTRGDPFLPGWLLLLIVLGLASGWIPARPLGYAGGVRAREGAVTTMS